MSLCKGTKCKMRNECANYFVNLPPRHYQTIDWSVYGSASIGVNGIEEHWYCGDLSDGYPLFEEVDYNKFPLRFNVFIIQAKDTNEEYKNCRYHAGGGVMIEDIKGALFHSSRDLADAELELFDEPDGFEVKELYVKMRMK